MDAWTAHALLGTAVVLLVFPLGIARFHGTFWPAWVSHWVVQCIGTLLLVMTSAIGLFKSHSLHHAHQYIGLSTTFLALLQVFLGILKHKQPEDSRMRFSLRIFHFILGFSCFFLACFSITSGFSLADINRMWIIWTTLLALVEMGALMTLGVRRFMISQDELSERYRSVAGDDEERQEMTAFAIDSARPSIETLEK